MPLRLLLAAVVFGILFYIVDLNELANTFLNLQIKYVVLLFAIAVVMIWLSALKWQVFIKSAGHKVGILRLMKLYTVGYFFNTFTPSYIGGDIARSFHLGQFLKSQKDAFAATFLERFTGLLAMSMLGVLFVLLGAEVTAGVEAAIFVVASGAAVLAMVFFSERFCNLFEKIARAVMVKFLPEKYSSKLDRILTKVLDAIANARGNYDLFTKAMLLSLAFHVGTVVNTYVAARAVGWENPSFMGLFIVVPLVLLVSMAPITPSGLGIQEGAFLFFLQRLGATSAQGLGVGVVLRAKVMVIAALGGVLWLMVRGSESKKPENVASDAENNKSPEEEKLLVGNGS